MGVGVAALPLLSQQHLSIAKSGQERALLYKAVVQAAPRDTTKESDLLIPEQGIQTSRATERTVQLLGDCHGPVSQQEGCTASPGGRTQKSLSWTFDRNLH